MKKNNLLQKILACFLIFITYFYMFVPQNYFYVLVRGKSMEPTLRDFQLIVVSKDLNNLAVGDVVIIQRNKETVIKRITAVSGAKYVENFVGEHSFTLIPDWVHTVLTAAQGTRLTFKKIPPGYYFVEGDNSSNSIDSRNFGLIPRSQITGRY